MAKLVSHPDPRCVVVAHHTPDVYGSDLQLLESVTALVGNGWRVVVVLPHDGHLVPLLEERGARVEFLPFPVLRRSVLTPRGLATMAFQTVRFLPRGRRLLKRHRANAAYVNTLIIPHWILASRLAGVPVLCHVHEAQTEGSRLLRMGLAVPLTLAHRVVVNSQASLDAIRHALPASVRNATVLYNGIEGPIGDPTPAPSQDGQISIVQVGRLSPRKGTDVALRAVALLAERGVDLRIQLAGDIFPGYEWYLEELKSIARSTPLRGRVEFLGYVRDRWSLLKTADIVLVPSRTEPFGNTAVEAQLAMRAVVASRVDGLQEVVCSGESGILVPPDDAVALAEAIGELASDPALRARLAQRGRDWATSQFGLERYARGIADEVSRLSEMR